MITGIMTNNSKEDQEMTKSQRQESLFERLSLDGFLELYKARSLFNKALWAVSVVFFYGCAIGLTIIAINRYHNIGLKIDVQEQPPKSTFQFPSVTVCHSGNFNKTFVEETIRIPESVLQKAIGMKMQNTKILEEFARYLRMFNSAAANNAGTFADDEWAMMTEIFEHNFRDINFADFLSDAAFRGKEVFRKCEYDHKRYSCMLIPMVVDTPSCYALLIERHSSMFNFQANVSNTATTKGLKFEMSVSSRHIFEERDINDASGSKQLGVNLFLSSIASPLSEMLAFPGDTHAVVEVQSTEIRLQSDCYISAPSIIDELSPDGHSHAPSSTPIYSRDICLLEAVQNVTRQTCKCHQTGGTYYPSNGLVCTPNHMKNCVLENIGSLDQADRYNRLIKTYCKPMCNDYAYSATVNYYNIEPTDNTGIITNEFEIFYYAKRQFLQVERQLISPYEIFYNIGSLVVVYTGLSVAAAARTILVLAIAGWKAFERKFVKKAIGQCYLDKVPLATTFSNVKPKKRSKIPIMRSIRVQPI